MKQEAVYQSISDVAASLNVPAHVLRFWETQFVQIKPMKRVGGRRYYRAEDVALLQQIYDLLYKQGYTIKGAQKYLTDAEKKTALPVQKSDKTADFIDQMRSLRTYLKDFLK